jgi:2-polyprenyl-6-hydroxyphenyl methylase/3-demethylubiquinone-9 3-methyltransferase
MCADRLNEVYHGQVYSQRVVQELRDRIHWMCDQVTGQRVLDIGCSQGIVSLLLAREGFEVRGVDLDAEAIQFALAERAKESDDTQARLEFVHESIFTSALEPQSYDTIVLGEVLEHLTNPTGCWIWWSPGSGRKVWSS